MLKYREIFPNATVSEYSYKKEPKSEKVVRCIRLKSSEQIENPEKENEKKIFVEGNALDLIHIRK